MSFFLTRLFPPGADSFSCSHKGITLSIPIITHHGGSTGTTEFDSRHIPEEVVAYKDKGWGRERETVEHLKLESVRLR